MTDTARPRDDARLRRLFFASGATVPNHPDLPALLVAGAVEVPLAPDAMEALFRANGWGGTWIWSVFDYHHFHPDAHEALGCVAGWADLVLGGPSGEALRVTAGDVVILPAGTGHCLTASGDGFRVCGAYPPGQEGFSTVRADDAAPPDAKALDALRRVPLPESDPVFGPYGPLLDAWG